MKEINNAKGNAAHVTDNTAIPVPTKPLTNHPPITSPDLARNVSMKTVDLYLSCCFSFV